MKPDFSPLMLRGFVHARIQMAGYRAEFPDDRKGARRDRPTFEQACAKERAWIIKRADITPEQLDLVLAGRKISPAPRLRLWQALGADPGKFGVLLVGMAEQEAIR